jgi:hypothetical protein
LLSLAVMAQSWVTAPPNLHNPADELVLLPLVLAWLGLSCSHTAPACASAPNRPAAAQWYDLRESCSLCHRTATSACRSPPPSCGTSVAHAAIPQTTGTHVSSCPPCLKNTSPVCVNSFVRLFVQPAPAHLLLVRAGSHAPWPAAASCHQPLCAHPLKELAKSCT